MTRQIRAHITAQSWLEANVDDDSLLTYATNLVAVIFTVKEVTVDKAAPPHNCAGAFSLLLEFFLVCN